MKRERTRVFKTCENPDCQALFYGISIAKFCSMKCNKHVYFKKFLERKEMTAYDYRKYRQNRPKVARNFEKLEKTCPVCQQPFMAIKTQKYCLSCRASGRRAAVIKNAGFKTAWEYNKAHTRP